MSRPGPVLQDLLLMKKLEISYYILLINSRYFNQHTITSRHFFYADFTLTTQLLCYCQFFKIFSIMPSSGKLLVEMRKSCKALWHGDYSGENANSKTTTAAASTTRVCAYCVSVINDARWRQYSNSRLFIVFCRGIF